MPSGRAWMRCWMVRSTAVPWRAGSGMTMPRSSRNCRTRRIVVPGRLLSALMSASGMGAPAPTQASSIRRVLVPLLRGALFQPRSPGLPVELLDHGPGGGGEDGQLVQGAGGQAAPVPAGVEQDGLRGINQVRRDRLRRPLPGRRLPSRLAGGGDIAGGLLGELVLAVGGKQQRRCPRQAHSGEKEPELERSSRQWLSTHPGSWERMISRQGRHSPSRLTWLTRPQRRQASWPGKARRHLAQAAQEVFCLI